MKLITAFGDSIMRGVVLDKATDKPRYTLLEENFSTRCGSALGLEIHNHGRYGNTTSHGLRELTRRQEQIASSDFCVLEFGGNDCDYNWNAIAERPSDEHKPKTPMEQFMETYSSMIDRVKSLGSTPVLLSLPVLDPERFFNFVTRGLDKANVLKWLGGTILSIDRWHAMYNMAVFRLGAMKKVPVIDITSVFLEKKNYSEYICEDGIHPNERGHGLIEKAIMEFLQERRVALQ